MGGRVEMVSGYLETGIRAQQHAAAILEIHIRVTARAGDQGIAGIHRIAVVQQAVTFAEESPWPEDDDVYRDIYV